MFNFRETEIVDSLSRTVNSNLVINLKPPYRSGIKRPNTKNTTTTEYKEYNYTNFF